MQGEMRITVIATGFTGEIVEPSNHRTTRGASAPPRTAPMPSEPQVRKQPQSGSSASNDSLPKSQPHKVVVQIYQLSCKIVALNKFVDANSIGIEICECAVTRLHGLLLFTQDKFGLEIRHASSAFLAIKFLLLTNCCSGY